MSSITFKALIDAVHVDPKKGVVKIQLIAGEAVSIDSLMALGPTDENIKVTLENAQTKITEVGEKPISELQKEAEQLGPADSDLSVAELEEKAEEVGDLLEAAEEEEKKETDKKEIVEEFD